MQGSDCSFFSAEGWRVRAWGWGGWPWAACGIERVCICGLLSVSGVQGLMSRVLCVWVQGVRNWVKPFVNRP